MTILVVDDHEPLLRMVKVVLEKNGHEFLGASNCEEALAVYAGAERSVGLVVLDLDMPGANGFQTLARLRELDGDVRAVLMSGGGVDPEEVVRNGFLGFLPKPFSLSRLLALTGAATRPSTKKTEKVC